MDARLQRGVRQSSERLSCSIVAMRAERVRKEGFRSRHVTHRARHGARGRDIDDHRWRFAKANLGSITISPRIYRLLDWDIDRPERAADATPIRARKDNPWRSTPTAGSSPRIEAAIDLLAAVRLRVLTEQAHSGASDTQGRKKVAADSRPGWVRIPLRRAK